MTLGVAWNCDRRMVGDTAAVGGLYRSVGQLWLPALSCLNHLIVIFCKICIYQFVGASIS